MSYFRFVHGHDKPSYTPEEPMKTEQTNTPDPQLRQQLDAKSEKFDEA